MREDYTVYIHLLPYQNEARESELARLDQHAVHDIERLEETITILKEYRKQLYEHTRQLQELDNHLQLSLKREKRYSGKVFYYLTIKRVYPTNERMYQEILSERYEGPERFTALKRFDILKKQYPGIEAIKDIEKGRWER